MWPPAPWPGLSVPVAAASRPSRTTAVLHRARHPSFSTTTARTLVSSLSRREVRRLWAVTARLLADPMPDAARLNLVILREQLLDRLEPAGRRD